MIRQTMLAVCCIGVATAAPAVEVSLEFKTIPAKEVMSFPGGYGTYAQVHGAKTGLVKKEPKAASQYPVYGEFRPGEDSFAFRIDESKGTGTGYDRLVIDMNRNGDLTDDAAIARIQLEEKRQVPTGYEQILFGPIKLPGVDRVAGAEPICYAQAYLYNVRLLRSGNTSGLPSVGQMRFRSGWYAAGTVELQGVKRRVALYDGDSNFKVGDASTPQFYNSGSTKSWFFRQADALLVDADDSGSFDNDAFQTEALPFGNLVYLASKPYKLSVDKGCKAMSLQPWTEALTEVSIEPRGAQVRDVALARAVGKDEWELVRASTANGKISLPAGSYRFNACVLAGQKQGGDQILASGNYREIPETLTFAAGKKNTLRCGGTLDVKVKAEKTRTDRSMNPRDKGPADSDYVVSINATVEGAAGETYSSYASGKKLQDDPPKPAFTIVDASGKTLGNGNLEYG